MEARAYLAVLEEAGVLEDRILETANLILKVLTKKGVHWIFKSDLLERKDIPFIDYRAIFFNDDFYNKKDVETMLIERALYLLLSNKDILQIGKGIYALNRKEVFTDENLARIPIHGKLGSTYRSNPESDFLFKF